MRHLRQGCTVMMKAQPLPGSLVQSHLVSVRTSPKFRTKPVQTSPRAWNGASWAHEACGGVRVQVNRPVMGSLPAQDSTQLPFRQLQPCRLTAKVYVTL